jgi:hypothetical protein
MPPEVPLYLQRKAAWQQMLYLQSLTSTGKSISAQRYGWKIDPFSGLQTASQILRLLVASKPAAYIMNAIYS